MALIVQKYGGSSVADAEKIANVARRVAEHAPRQPGWWSSCPRWARRPTGSSTLAQQVHAVARSARDGHAPRHRRAGDDRAARHGAARRSGSRRARSRARRPACAPTPRTRRRASRASTPSRVRQALDAGEIAVVAGFQGLSEADEIATLGRGGSDLTGRGARRGAARPTCARSTRTSTASTPRIPNIVPDARKLDARHVRRDARDGEPRRQGAAGAVGGVREEVGRCPCTCARRSSPTPARSSPGRRRRMEERRGDGRHPRSEPGEDLDPARARSPGHRGAGRSARSRTRNIVVDMIVQNISRDGYTDMSFTRAARRLPARRRPCWRTWPRKVGAQGVRPRRARGEGLHRRRRACAATPASPSRMFARPRARGHQHPDDLHLGDRRVVRDRGQVRGARRARAPRHVRGGPRAGGARMKGKAAVFHGPGKPFEIRDVPIPDIEPDAVLIRVSLANICGSDLHFWRGDAPLRIPEDGWIFGHEMMGRVAKLGAQREDRLARPAAQGRRPRRLHLFLSVPALLRVPEQRAGRVPEQDRAPPRPVDVPALPRRVRRVLLPAPGRHALQGAGRADGRDGVAGELRALAGALRPAPGRACASAAAW